MSDGSARTLARVRGDLLDLVLVAALVAFAVSGFRQGFVVGVLSFVGFLAGAAAGAQLAPQLVQRYLPHANEAVVGLLVVFVAASLGQALAAAVGMAVRRRLTWRPVRLVDSAGGAAVSVVSVLLVAWLVGTAVAHSTLTGLARQVQRSRVLATVDTVMPEGAKTWFSAFRRLLDREGFPQVFGGLGPERIIPVAPPDPRVLDSAAVRAARLSVVKVVGTAPECSRRLEGSGFAYAPRRVMTNAHVVAGVRRPQVLIGGDGAPLEATVVLYDPRRDVAVLDVPALQVPLLRFSRPAGAGTAAVVAGYPQDGPFTAVAARVRGSQDARGPDIYQRTQVTREIYSIRSRVLPGNSGGPLLAADGRVYGVVFAAAVDDSTTGYALTAAEVGGDAAAGRVNTARVGTGGCD